MAKIRPGLLSKFRKCSWKRVQAPAMWGFIEKEIARSSLGSGITDTTAVFNDSLTATIKNYQLRTGCVDGNITDSLLRLLKIRLKNVIQQISSTSRVHNGCRLKWIRVTSPSTYPISSWLFMRTRLKVFDMPVAVGKEGTNTTMFTGDLNQVVFSPYWNIPVSIVKNEILRRCVRIKITWDSRNMEQVG